MKTPTNTPGEYSIEYRWFFFAKDWMYPIIADGKIDHEEETPLQDSFIAYRINEVIDKFGPKKFYDEILPHAIERGLKNHQPLNPQLAWHRINRYLPAMPKAAYYRIKKWLLASAPKTTLADIFIEDQTYALNHQSACIYRKFLEETRKILANLLSDKEKIEVQPSRSSDTNRVVSSDVQTVPNGNHPSQATSEETKDISPMLPVYENFVIDVKNPDTPSTETITKLCQRLNAYNNKKTIIADFEQLVHTDSLDLAFKSLRSSNDDRIIVIKDELQEDLWFIGDLHSDILALEASLSYINNQNPLAKIVFLGDIFDGDQFNCEIILRIFELITKDSKKYCLLTGNHDCGLLYEDPYFSSSVSPHDFADELNSSIERKDANSDLCQKLGMLTISLFRNTPRALFLPDGLLAAHGGFPLKDTWADLHTKADLDSDIPLQDLIWTRASKGRHKRPNRTTKGCSFGYQDFEGFCAIASGILGQPVVRMIRGHDHIEDRYILFPEYQKNPMLTINTISHRLQREPSGGEIRIPCIARYRKNKIPEVHRLYIPENTISAIHLSVEQR